MSTTAPRAINGAACSGVQPYSSRPNPPAHQSLFRLRSAPYNSSKSTIGKLSLTMPTGRPPKEPIGALTAARTSESDSSRVRTWVKFPGPQGFSKLVNSRGARAGHLYVS